MNKINQKKIRELKEIINKSNNIVFFGGAGVSTASGLKDFRSKDGLYSDKSNSLNVFLFRMGFHILYKPIPILFLYALQLSFFS